MTAARKLKLWEEMKENKGAELGTRKHMSKLHIYIAPTMRPGTWARWKRKGKRTGMKKKNSKKRRN